MSGQLTTHVLDIMRGQPARGMKVEIWALFEGGRKQIRSAMTNDDGRLDAPLLAAPKMKAGLYEICFHVGAYFAQGGEGGEGGEGEPFLDIVPVRFRISDPEGSFHVPLLVSPWSYSTYRGS